MLNGLLAGDAVFLNQSALANISNDTQALAWYQAALNSTNHPDLVPTFTTQPGLNIVDQDASAASRMNQAEQPRNDSNNDSAGKKDAANSVLTIIDGGV